MTASLYGSLAKTILNLIRQAVDQGLSVANPIKLKLMGSTAQGDLAAPERYVNISFAKPAIYEEIQLWINPANRMIFKCDPVAHEWLQLFEYSDLFSPYNAIGGNTNAGGGTGSSATGQPVQALTDLQALPTSTTPDKTLIYVENERAIYAYDKTSIDNGPNVIVPATGVGRWLLVSNTSGGSLSLDGGMF